MTKITACKIFNQIDNKYYTLYVEWFNLHFKVMLLNSIMSPLTGEVSSQIKEIQNLNLINVNPKKYISFVLS